MSIETGIWIDHARAIIVSLTDFASPTVRTIESDMESHHKALGKHYGLPQEGQTHGSSERRYVNRRHGQVTKFLREVIDAAVHASELLILGPGEARLELVKEIERDGRLRDRVRAVFAAERMTEPQLIAFIKQHFKDRRGFSPQGSKTRAHAG